MEADWEIEIGGDAPVIEAQWAGFVDLRTSPDRARLLAEQGQLPGLADVLIRLNAPESPIWTSKCDVWPVSEFDPYELDASPDLPLLAIACYVDIVPRSEHKWPHTDKAEDACRAICARLRTVPLRCCRVDMVIRRALILADGKELGITAYFTACGSTLNDAKSVLVEALTAFAASVASDRNPNVASSKIQ